MMNFKNPTEQQTASTATCPALENVNILCIDTATEVCTVAVSTGDKHLICRENSDGHSHAKTLLPFIDEVLQEAGLPPSQLSAVAVGMGPGSYTGLRIGASTAKGLCYALQIPLIAISTLQAIAAGAKGMDANRICPLLDARRMEVFTALYDSELNELTAPSAVVMANDTFAELLANNTVVFCGNGMPKCQELLQHPNAKFCDAPLSATNMMPLAYKKFLKNDFVNVAYFEPLYGKEYVAAKPHVKGLR